jgi:hypothetical protein
MHFDSLHKLQQKEMVNGLPRFDHYHKHCNNCITTKLKLSPFPSQAKRQAEGILDLVHGDLCGPITPATSGVKKYFLLLVDDRSTYMWVSMMPPRATHSPP